MSAKCGAAYDDGRTPCFYFTGNKRVLTNETGIACVLPQGHAGPHEATTQDELFSNLIWHHKWGEKERWPVEAHPQEPSVAPSPGSTP